MQISRLKKTMMIFYVSMITFLSSYNKVFADDTIDCEGDTMTFIRDVFKWVKIAIPVLLILLGTIDFLKAITAGDDQKIKKAQKDFVTRLIVGAVIFFIPSVLEFLLSLLDINSCSIS